jgi:hypothetical protein
MKAIVNVTDISCVLHKYNGHTFKVKDIWPNGVCLLIKGEEICMDTKSILIVDYVKELDKAMKHYNKYGIKSKKATKVANLMAYGKVINIGEYEL